MKRRWVTGAAALATASIFFLASCGYLLYPERRGRFGGRMDTAVLVLDILWLLPGLVPGVIALAVDFSSGAIYLGGERRAKRTIPLPDDVGDNVTVTVELRDGAGRVLATKRLRVSRRDRGRRRLELSPPEFRDPVPRTAALWVAVGDAAPVRYALR